MAPESTICDIHFNSCYGATRFSGVTSHYKIHFNAFIVYFPYSMMWKNTMLMFEIELTEITTKISITRIVTLESQ